MPGSAAPVDSRPHSGQAAIPSVPPELLAFRRLDELLWPATEAARVRFGADAGADAFRGLYVSAEQAERRLIRPAGEPLVTGAAAPGPSWREIATAAPAWAWLRAAYGLTDLDLDVVLVALGPEVDLRYERLYGYLQDDVTRRRPTVDLALDLLTRTPADRLAARRAVVPGSALRRHRVITLHPDPRAVAPPLPAHHVVVDPQVVDVLLGQDGPDARLEGCARLVEPRAGDADGPDVRLLELVEDAYGRHPLRLYFQGPRGSGRHRAAEALAAWIGVSVLAVDLAHLPVDDEAAADAVEVVFRTASRQDALLHLDGVDALRHDERHPLRRRLAERLAGHGGLVTLAGTQDWTSWGPPPLGLLTVPFGRTAPGRRRHAWAEALASYGVPASPADLDDLGERFRLGPGRIEEAAATAVTAARLRVAGTGDAPTPDRRELFAAARAQSGHGLAALATKLELRRGWADIVLPADALAQLRELGDRVGHRGRVLEEWGFERALAPGPGVSALFAGPPGTGKTMAAEVIAGELGLDLYKINLAAVVSKYIGETEKNLERVFTAAADADAILLFDEADALFGKRSDVRDAHDRYANIEVAYLLQRMEAYDGLAILATNLRRNLDEAFTRRLHFIVEFPVPDVAERRRIWQVCLPADAPRDPDVDLDRLAAGFRLTGGEIRNVVLAAAFRAAAAGTPVGMSHLLAATSREHQKMGRVVAPTAPEPAGQG